VDQERKADRKSAPLAAATATGQRVQVAPLNAPLQLYFPPSVISPMPQALVGWVWCR